MSNYLFLMDQLEGEYKKAFDKVYIYTSVRNMEGETEQEMMMNLLDMMLTAQIEGKPVEKIIGNDVEKFCKSYFEEYNYKTRLKEQLPKYINRIMWFVFIFEMLGVLFSIGENEFDLLKETTDISGYMVGLVCGVGISVLFDVCVKPFIFKWKKITAAIYNAIVLVLSFAVVIVGCVVLGESELNIPVFPLLLISGLYILIYKLVQTIRRYKKYGTIWRRKEPFKESWLDSLKADINRQLPGEWVKRYNKMNRRRIRRGKEAMTIEAFMEKLHKENKQLDMEGRILGGLITLVVVGMVINTMITESVLDGIILGVIMCVMEVPIFKFFFVSNVKRRKLILEECEKRGITLIEYAERQKSNFKD